MRTGRGQTGDACLFVFPVQTVCVPGVLSGPGEGTP